MFFRSYLGFGVMCNELTSLLFKPCTTPKSFVRIVSGTVPCSVTGGCIPSWCSPQRTVGRHCANPIFCVSSSFISCALTYPFFLHVFSVFPLVTCCLFHWVFLEYLFPYHSSFAGGCLLLLVFASVSWQLKPYFVVRVAFIQSVIFISFVI